VSAPERLFVDEVQTPLGAFALIVDQRHRLRAAGFVEGHDRMARLLASLRGAEGATLSPRQNPGGVTRALKSYLAGDIDALEALPVAPRGTEFQRQVWRALRRVAPGTTASYAEVARQVGRPAAVRAVGLANGANPIALVVPCHRVIGADGSLTCYGGGLHRKRWLLRHEGCGVPDEQLCLSLDASPVATSR
jgi:methylated-DNA-[protein]-cysteine S-methyltransferase